VFLEFRVVVAVLAVLAAVAFLANGSWVCAAHECGGAEEARHESLAEVIWEHAHAQNAMSAGQVVTGCVSEQWLTRKKRSWCA